MPRRRVPGKAWFAALLVVAAAPSFVRSVCFDRLIGQPDTRSEARAWLAEAGATRADTWAFGFGGLPRSGFLTGEKLPWTDALRGMFAGVLPKDPAGAQRPRLILRDETATGADSFGWSAWEPVVLAEYRQAHRLDPRPDPEAVILPDPVAGTPTFFVPFTNPWAMERPGPVLALFERVEDRER